MSSENQIFDAEAFLETQGMRFGGFKDGRPIAVNEQGEEFDFDAAAAIESLGQDPSKFRIDYNAPQSAIAESPISFADRFKLSFAPPEEKLAYLKAQYGDATYDEEKGIVVRTKEGAWHEVDPNFFGEADLGRYVKGALKAAKIFAPALQASSNEGLGDTISQGFSGIGEMAGEAWKATKGAASSMASGRAIMDAPGDIAEMPAGLFRAALETGLAVAGSRFGALGEIAGAAGGAALATGANALIARSLGTSKQPAFEVAKQAGIDALLAGGAQWIATLNRPVVDTVAAAAGVGNPKGPADVIESFKRVGSKMDEKAQDSFAAMTESLTKRDKHAISHMMGHPERNIRTIGEVMNEVGSGRTAIEDGIRAAGEHKIKYVKMLAEEGSDALSANWVKGADEIKAFARETNAGFDAGDIMEGFAEAVNKVGAGKVVSKSTTKAMKDDAAATVKQIMPLMKEERLKHISLLRELSEARRVEAGLKQRNALGLTFDNALEEAIGKTSAKTAELQARVDASKAAVMGLKDRLATAKNTLKSPNRREFFFRGLSGDEYTAKLLAGKSKRSLGDSIEATLGSIVSDLEGLAKVGTVKGTQAVDVLIEAKKSISGPIRQHVKEVGAKSPLGQALTSLDNAIEDEFSKLVTQMGLGKRWKAFLDSHSQYATQVNYAREALGDPTGQALEALSNKLVGRPQKNIAVRGMVDALPELIGPRGKYLHGKFMDYHTAQQFIKDTPEIGLLQAFGIGGILASASGQKSQGVRVGLLATGAALLGQSNPRTVAKEAAAMAALKRSLSQRTTQFQNFLTRLAPLERAKFLRDPRMMDAVTRTLVESEAQEEMMKHQLLNGGGQ